MRLLRLTDHGELVHEEFDDNDIPPYAILSHTWGADSEEISFKDLVRDAGKSKVGSTGYNKIMFCAKQAAFHGIPYFWIDSCCIDKANSAELSEAINSMFRWYRNSDICFAYLSDVSAEDGDVGSERHLSKFEFEFRNCRWFTRGWTLQELLAPPSVQFFSREGELLGEKRSLERLIHKITGIPVGALRGSPLSEFTVQERMSWARNRTTKRKEDQAYCLLGIFDVFMPLIYGEGKEHAFIRLMEGIEKSSSKFSQFAGAFIGKRIEA
jgi:hypothetical protein